MLPAMLTFLSIRLFDKLKRWRRKYLYTGWRLLGGFVTFILAIWGLCGIWDYYQPSIEVTPTAWYTKDPFNSDFLVKNTSHYALNNVLANCVLLKATSPTSNQTLKGVLLSHYMMPVPTLNEGESKTVQCRNTMLQLPWPVIADLVLEVEYNNPLRFWKSIEHDPHRFATELDNSTNSLKWQARALSEPMP